MKRLLQISGIAFLIMLFSSFRNTTLAQPGVYVSYQTFYDELSPYGQWIDYPEYGYVWQPAEGPDFRPYSTGGHWVWSDEYEWMWVSDYSWGWAPFHYGRWFYDDYYGWLWMPGYEWSPAWVAWRSGGDYYGWAPLRPGISISIGFSIGSYSPPYNYWCFAPSRYITSPRIYNYCVSPRQNVTIINNTTIFNNYNYNRNVFVTGPRRTDAERYTNSRINSVRVRDISNPRNAGFRRNEVSIYRPSVRQENNRSFAPKRFDTYRGNNNVARNNNFNDRRNSVNDRDGRNNRFEKNEPARNNDNFNRRELNRNEAQRPADNNRRFQQPQRNNIPAQQDNNRFERNNNERRIQQNNDEMMQRNNNNAVRERNIRETFGRDNRPGIDQPVQRNRIGRTEQPARNNDNFNRREISRPQPQQQLARNNDNFNRREVNRNVQRPDNNNRNLSNNAAQPQQRREAFSNNRNFNRQPQQRQSAPEIRRQEQPRQFSQPNRAGSNDKNNNGNGNGGRGHRRG